jgi:hypothetical protein
MEGFMVNRRQLMIAAGAGLTALLAGCLSPAGRGGQLYNERIASVLISGDGRYLVALSPEFHYVFEAPPVLVQSIRGSFHPFVAAMPAVFRVRRDGTTEGDLYLTVSPDAGPTLAAAAFAAGYQPWHDERGRAGAITRIKLKGKRYAASVADVGKEASYRLNRIYDVPVEVDGSAGEVIAAAMATPVSRAAGGVLMLFGAPLVAILNAGKGEAKGAD